MGFCIHCEIYFKKLPKTELCNRCMNQLCGTPPKMNNMLTQYEKFLHEKKLDIEREEKFNRDASLLDQVTKTMILNVDLIIELAKTLPEGHPPWYSLLRAWYRENRQRPRGITNEKFPKRRLYKLLDLTYN